MKKLKYAALFLLVAAIVLAALFLKAKNDRYHDRPLEALSEIADAYKGLPDFIRKSDRMQTAISDYLTSLLETSEPAMVSIAKKSPKKPGVYRIVAFGDSTTAAVNIPTSAIWWPAILKVILERKAPGREYEVINAGIPGTCVRHGVARIERDVISLSPDLVTLSFGLNDGQVLYFDEKTVRPYIPFEEFRGTLKQMTERIVREAGCPVILWTMPRTGSDYASERGRDAQTAQRKSHEKMREIIREVARETGQPLADIYQIMNSEEWPDVLIDKDEFHPAPRAQPLIAKAVFDVWEKDLAGK